MPTILESLEAVLLIWMRFLRFVIACAAVKKVAVAVFSRHRFAFGSAGYTGHRFFLSSPHYAKGIIRTIPWNSSKAFVGCGVQPSIVGETIFVNCFPKALPTGVWPGT
jgi:hypothetical protein